MTLKQYNKEMFTDENEMVDVICIMHFVLFIVLGVGCTSLCSNSIFLWEIQLRAGV